MKRILIGLLVGICSATHAAMVTLTVQGGWGSATVTNDKPLQINAYEVAELVSLPYTDQAYRPFLIIEKDDMQITFERVGNYNYYTQPIWDPLVVAGPATIRLAANGGRKVLSTFKVTPEPFPPDRTVIALPGTNQTAVTLECSTNLVDWVSATNGVYGPMPEAKFFRIKAQKN
jgi:hypothetical protein